MQNKLIAGVAVIALVLGVFGLTRSSTETVVRETVKEIGAVSSPDITNPWTSVNGVYTYSYSTGLNKASTTVCSFKTPPATSTLVFASAQVTTGTTTATIWDIGKATTLDATTTKLGTSYTLASAAQGTIVASTTVENIFSPNTFLNVKYGGTIGILNVFVGSCKAEFIVN